MCITGMTFRVSLFCLWKHWAVKKFCVFIRVQWFKIVSHLSLVSVLEAADSRFWLCQLTSLEPMHYSKHSGNGVSDPLHWGFEMLLWVLDQWLLLWCILSDASDAFGRRSISLDKGRGWESGCGKRKVLSERGGANKMWEYFHLFQLSSSPTPLRVSGSLLM